MSESATEPESYTVLSLDEVGYDRDLRLVNRSSKEPRPRAISVESRLYKQLVEPVVSKTPEKSVRPQPQQQQQHPTQRGGNRQARYGRGGGGRGNRAEATARRGSGSKQQQRQLLEQNSGPAIGSRQALQQEEQRLPSPPPGEEEFEASANGLNIKARVFVPGGAVS